MSQVTNKHGCVLTSGFMGEFCDKCGADNFGGGPKEICKSEEEKEQRLQESSLDSERMMDDASIENFAKIMKDKMEVSRKKGRRGWHDTRKVNDYYLAELFWNHLNKTNDGNFVDLANFLMMLHIRNAPNDILMKTVSEK